MTAATAVAPATVPRDRGALAGTGTLLRFALRRDRVRIPVWLAALTVFVLASSASLTDLYPDAASRAAVAASQNSPAALALSGPAHYLSDYTYGAIISHQTLGATLPFVAIMTLLLVVRHTRAEEEAGRAELLRAAAVGRHAHLASALAAALLANLALAALLAAGLAGLGMESVDVPGAVLFGAAHLATGMVFAGVAAVTAQVSAHSRATSGTALAVLGAAFVLRAAGDAGDGTLSWASPIGWAQRAYPFLDDRWWPLLPSLGVALAASAAGFALSTRRDVGAGLRAARTGRRTASAALGHPLGMALRLHRGLLVSFAAAVIVLGAAYGSVLGDVEDMLDDIQGVTEALREAGGPSLTATFAALTASLLAMVASVHTAMAMQRPRAEETGGRAEPLLATGLSRARWAAGHLAVAWGGAVVLLGVGGLSLGLSGAGSTGEASYVGDLTAGALAHAPALWLVAGVAVALYGWAPGATGLVWAVPVFAFVAGYLGQLLQFPGWLVDLSPFAHVPSYPAEDLTWTPLLVLTALAAGLTALGLAGLRRRDLLLK